MKRNVVIAAVLILAVGGLVWANARKLDGQGAVPAGAAQPSAKAQGPAGAPLVKVEPAARRSLTQEVLAPGSVEAGAVQEMRAPFSSRQIKLLAGMGDKVKAGQVLAELAAEELSAQVMAQEAQVARAEAALAGLRLQQQQAPVQLAQRLEQARGQLLQAEEGLSAASRQSEALRRRLEQARGSLELLQGRSAAGSAQVESARQALVKAEEAYRRSPSDAQARQAYEQARSGYDAALQQSQEAARQAAADLRRAYDELDAAQKEYAQSGGENPVALQLARSQVESARLAVRLAEMEAESGGTVASQVRSAEADLAAARTTLAQLKEKLEKARLVAPADGTILSVGAKESQPVQEQQLLFTVGDLEAMKVTARVDEIDIGKVKVGQPLSVKSNAHPQSRFGGKVVRVSAQTAAAAQGAGTFFEVEGRVANEGGLLKSGMNAEVTITAEQKDGIFVVGLAAVREEGEKAFLLVVEDFKVKLRPVKLGLRTQTEVEVVEGLKEGDLVVVSPFTLINSLKEGDAVRTEVAGDGGK